jgi:type I restriction enzyme S subunit
VGDVLTLCRKPVSIDPSQQYREIGIRSFGKGIIRQTAVPGSGLSKLRYFEVPPRALMLSNIMAWEGAIAVSSNDDAGYVASNRFLSYVPVRDDEVDVGFACALFLSKTGFPLIQRASPGSIARNRTLGIDAFEGLEIPLPRVEAQRRIASRLNHVQATTRVFLDTADSQLRELAALVDRQLQELPATATMGDLMSLDVDVVSVEPNEEYRSAGVYSFGRGLFERGKIRGTDTSYTRLHRLHAGQVAMSRLKAFEGAVAVVRPEFDGWVLSPEFPTFSPRTDVVYPPYLEMLCKWTGLRTLMQKASRGIGARRERVSADAFLAIPIPLPDYEHQRRLGSLYAKAHAVRQLDERRRTLLDRLTASALDHAFAGLA